MPHLHTLVEVRVMSDPPIDPKPASELVEHSDQPRIIEAEQLFQGAHEVWIEYRGIRYRLRITRRNKLILQK